VVLLGVLKVTGIIQPPPSIFILISTTQILLVPIGTTVIPEARNGGAIPMEHSHQSNVDSKQKEIVTEPLTVLLMKDCLSEIAPFFVRLGFEVVTVMYGWGSKLPNDKLWQPFNISVSQIQEIAERSEMEGIFELGKSDLIIQSPKKEVIFTLCHESDVHFVSGTESYLEEFVRWWHGKGVSLSESSYTVSGPRSWMEIQ